MKPAFDFDAILRREAPPFAVTKLQNAVLSAEVEAAAPPEVKNDKRFIHVAIPIGTGATIQCWVYGYDPASVVVFAERSARPSLAAVSCVGGGAARDAPRVTRRSSSGTREAVATRCVCG